LGLGGSDDIRELLEREQHGDERAGFALEVYVYAIQKAIGQMAAVTGGADILVFTGTIGERSDPERERIVAGLEYLYFRIDRQHNNTTFEPRDVANVAEAHSQPILVVGTDEASEIARRTTDALHCIV
jgi:acetate kinase